MKIVLIKIEEIVPPEIRMRQNFDVEALEQLKESLKNQGLINPITVKKLKKGYEIMAGDRRLEAAKQIGWTEIAAIIYASEGLDSEKVKIAENIVREDVNVIDEGLYLLQIKEKYACSQKELANMINRAESYVSERIKATDWNPELKRALKENLITFSVARELSKLESDDQLYACLNSAVEYGTTPDQARRWVRDYKAQVMSEEASGSYNGLSAEEQLIAPSVLLQSCQICHVANEPRDMIYLTVCRSCSDTIKKAM